MPPIALTIAGSDPSGGAGIQADLKTFHQYGVYGTSVLTLLTVQNTCRVSDVKHLPASFVLEQLDAVLEDLEPQAAKAGALGTGEVIEAIAGRAVKFSFPLVIDPVMISKHGAPMMEESARATFVKQLLPCAYLLTPNLEEAAALSGYDCGGLKQVEEAAKAIAGLGARNVLVKGGHLTEDATDILYMDGSFYRFSAKRIPTANTHGTGCTYSAAITAQLAKGVELREAISCAKEYITRAIEGNPSLGHGQGPLNHHAPIRSQEVTGIPRVLAVE